jgi:hypothetical protein
MISRIARLFTIKTRTEAYLIIYAIAAGAIERGRHYMDVFPGTLGLVMALLCTGVVFLAGAKLLDGVRPQPAALTPKVRVTVYPPRRRISRSRPTRSRNRAAGSAAICRTD